MAKRYWTGDLQPAKLRDRHGRLCLACRRPVIHGDRCQDCRDKLRARRNRKPR